MKTEEQDTQTQAHTETPNNESTDPGVELAHEVMAAALAGIGQVLHAKFSHETLTGIKRKYNTD